MTRKVQLKFTKPSKTVKSAAYEADINNMVSGKTPWTQSKSAFYIDETILPESYEEAFNMVREAQDAFMSLPPQIRAQFANDPARLSKALSDPSQHDALRELGILPPLPSAPEAQRPQKAGGAEGAASEGGSNDADA
jgi:phage internal scaffolding protein